jgi:hypothetical protein
MLLPGKNVVLANTETPEEPVEITEVVTDEDSGVSLVEQVPEEDGGDVTSDVTLAQVSWQTSSTLRRIEDIFGRVFVDNVSQTSIDRNSIYVGVAGTIWLQPNPQYTCSATLFVAKVVNCETQDVRAPGTFRGTGVHNYDVGGGKVSLPGTDTGWRSIS